jgi:hypothetical protein
LSDRRPDGGAGRSEDPERGMEMRKLIVVAALLAGGAFALDGAAVQQAQGQSSEEEMKVTGMVTEADQDTKEIQIEDETYVMPEESGGASLFPQVGSEVTLFYTEEDGKKVITRIGQAQE